MTRTYNFSDCNVKITSIPNFKAHKHLTVLEKYVKTLNLNKTQTVCFFLDQHPII